MERRGGVGVHPHAQIGVQSALRQGFREDRVLSLPRMPRERMGQHGQDPSGAALGMGRLSPQVRRVPRSSCGIRRDGILEMEGPPSEDDPDLGGDGTGSEAEVPGGSVDEDGQGRLPMRRGRVFHGGRRHRPASEGLLLRRGRAPHRRGHEVLRRLRDRPAASSYR